MEIYQKLLEKLFIDNPWLAAFLALLPTLVPSVVLWYKGLAAKREARTDSDAQRNTKRTAEIDAQIAALGNEQKERIVDFKKEIHDLREDNNRGWNLARYWFRRAYELLIKYDRLAAQNISLIQWIQSANRVEPTLPLPMGLMDNLPQKIILPQEMEDPKDDD